MTAGKALSGRELDKLWNVGARHALYHREGSWYNNLRRFPAALFDPAGYVLFESEHSYRACPYLRVTKETNVRNGISSMPNYVREVAVSKRGLAA